MERLPTAKFPEPVLWLRCGDQQLHLFESNEDAPTPRQHVSFDVDDFDAVYAKAKEMGILDSKAFGSPLATHPAGWVQLYLRDPAGNLLEVDWPDAARSRRRPSPTPQELGGPGGRRGARDALHRHRLKPTRRLLASP